MDFQGREGESSCRSCLSLHRAIRQVVGNPFHSPCQVLEGPSECPLLPPASSQERRLQERGEENPFQATWENSSPWPGRKRGGRKPSSEPKPARSRSAYSYPPLPQVTALCQLARAYISSALMHNGKLCQNTCPGPGWCQVLYFSVVCIPSSHCGNAFSGSSPCPLQRPKQGLPLQQTKIQMRCYPFQALPVLGNSKPQAHSMCTV
jgi:hypothetical protein